MPRKKCQSLASMARLSYPTCQRVARPRVGFAILGSRFFVANLALLVHQSVANGSKLRHKAKVKNRRILRMLARSGNVQHTAAKADGCVASRTSKHASLSRQSPAKKGKSPTATSLWCAIRATANYRRTHLFVLT